MTTAARSARRIHQLGLGWVAVALFCVSTASAQSLQQSAPSGDSANTGELSGQVIVVGRRPQIAEEIIPADQAVCAAGGLGMSDDHITIGAGGGLADVFVMLTPLDETEGQRAAPENPATAREAPAPTVITFANCRIAPHASIVTAGTPLVLVNDDPVGHQVQIQTWNNEVNFQLPTATETRIRLDRPDPVPGQIQCGIHRWMDGVILVADHRPATLTDGNGRFRFADLPAGEWRVQFWHSRIGYLSGLILADQPRSTDEKGAFDVAITAGESLELGELAIDGQRFREFP